MTRVYEEAEKLFKAGQINEALAMIEESGVVPADSPDLWILKARCLEQLNRHDDAFEAAYEVFQVGCNSFGILNTLGEGYMRRGDYSLAYDMFVLARDAIPDKDDKACFEMKCRQAKNKLKKQKQRERRTKKFETSASVKRGVPVEAVRGVPVEATSTGKEASIEAATVGLSRDIESHEERFENASLMFDATFGFHVTGLSMKGKMCNEQGVSFPYSLVRISGTHSAHKLEYLRELCSEHECLLSLFHVVRHPSDNSMLWVVEPTYTFDEFFLREREKFPVHLTKEAWWERISTMFRVYFRDVIRALRFLYVEKNRSCVDLSFNFFVTNDGRARILPSMNPTSKGFQFDLNDLMLQMKRLIFFSLEMCEIDHLPCDLVRLFNFIQSCKSLPAAYLIDHPFFWSIEEKIAYPQKLRKMMRKSKSRMSLNFELETNAYFGDWSERLEGKALYFKIWERGDPERQDCTKSSSDEDCTKSSSGVYEVQRYKLEIDIVRFFTTVYAHANEKEYADARQKKHLTDEELEKDLSEIFPDFYTKMYECVGICACSGTPRRSYLRELASSY